LDNGCRYSPEDQPVVLKGRAMSEGVLVSVTDHGSGIRREVATKAFNEPFTAGEEILRKERSGAGVGLHMARQIVMQHGGIMWAEPLPAGGSRVSFVIPSQEGQTVTQPPTIADPDAAAGTIDPPEATPSAESSLDDGGTVVPFHQRTSSASSS
jgi:K+-sensing histidine kinase KdpD